MKEILYYTFNRKKTCSIKVLFILNDRKYKKKNRNNINLNANLLPQ